MLLCNQDLKNRLRIYPAMEKEIFERFGQNKGETVCLTKYPGKKNSVLGVIYHVYFKLPEFNFVKHL